METIEKKIKDLSIKELRGIFNFDKENSSWIVTKTKNGDLRLHKNNKLGNVNAKSIITVGGEEVLRITGVSGKEALYKAKQKVK